MSNPFNEVGQVTGELRFTTDRAQKDIKEGLEKAGRETDAVAAKLGSEHGNTYGKSFADKSDDYFKRAGTSLGDTLKDLRRSFNFDLFDFTPGDEDRARRRGRSIFGSLFDGIRDAITTQGKGIGDLFQNILGGPVGAFFNVSGKSPLLLLLIPLLGFIITLITALIYGLQAAISLLYLVPGLLFAIGLQGAALFFIFSGLGEVISAAFAATNAEELEKALQGVNGQVAEFVRALIPWRDFFKQLRIDAQFAFFDFLDASKITTVLDNIAGPFGQAIVNIAAAFGLVANSLLDVFASPAFAELINTLGASTVDWLLGLGPALANFIDGLNQFGVDLDGFLDWFGDQFNMTIFNWGETLKSLGEDPKFMQWIEDSKVILGDFMDLLGSVVNLVIVFVQQFIKADKDIEDTMGKGFLDGLREMIDIFTAFLATQVGQDAITAFIYGIIGLTVVFLELAMIVLLFVGALNAFADTIGNFFSWLGGSVVPAIGAFFSMIGTQAEEVLSTVVQGVPKLIEAVGHFFNALGTAAHDKLEEIKRGIGDWFDQLSTDFYYSGINLIMRLVDGIDAALPFLNLKMDAVGKAATSHLNQSPAEVGPLSGKGDPLLSGKTLVKRLATGIEMETPALTKAMNSATSNLVFDPGSIQVNYYGGIPPTNQQAMGMGKAAGQGITNELISTRIAVRTL